MSHLQEADVVVIGGGVAGTALTYHLANKGANVILLERSYPGDSDSGVTMSTWCKPPRLDTLSLNTLYIPASYSLPVISHIPLEADSPKRNAASSYYTHFL